MLAAEDEHGAAVAVKLGETDLVAREAAVLSKLRGGAGVIPLLDSFALPDLAALVLPRADCSLEDVIDTGEVRMWPWPLSVSRTLFGAVAYAHARGLLHLDVKPANVLVTGDRVVLADWGGAESARRLGRCPDAEGHYVVTRPYRAPEAVLGLPLSGAVDAWSVACVSFELLGAGLLFPAEDQAVLVTQFVELLGAPPASMLAAASAGAVELYFCGGDHPPLVGWTPAFSRASMHYVGDGGEVALARPPAERTELPGGWRLQEWRGGLMYVHPELGISRVRPRQSPLCARVPPHWWGAEGFLGFFRTLEAVLAWCPEARPSAHAAASSLPRVEAEQV